jgi:ribosomal protein S21
VETLLAEVRVQEGEPLENALRRFKRKVQQEDIIKEVKRHSYYLKLSANLLISWRFFTVEKMNQSNLRCVLLTS